MITFGSVFLCISSVSALILNPDSRLTSSSATNLSNISVPDTVESPWSTSSGLETLPIPKNTTRLSTPTVTRPLTWRCNKLLGLGPYAESCEDAAHYMAFIYPESDESQQFEWGRRDWSVSRGIPLPQEVVSSDGHCRINVHMRPGSPWSLARASQSQVRAGASAVIRNCIRNEAPPQGGTASHISDDGLLDVWVWMLTGDEVFGGTCYGRMAVDAETSCKWVLDNMRVNLEEEYVFGPGSDPDAEVHLPYSIVSPDRRCALTIRTAGPSDTTFWVNLWEVAVELTSICARRGMQGREVRLGDAHHLAVFLTDPSVEDIDVS